jgi:hypothetical protein
LRLARERDQQIRSCCFSRIIRKRDPRVIAGGGIQVDQPPHVLEGLDNFAFAAICSKDA